MDSQQEAAIKIQAIWRGYWARNFTILSACSDCRRFDCIYNLNIFNGKNLCHDCYDDIWEEESRYRFCHCRDPYCHGGCGELRCGCIDVCRCYASWNDY